MRKFILMILLTISFFCNAQDDRVVQISKEYVQFPVEQFIKEVFTTTSFPFYIKPDWHPSGFMNINPGTYPLVQILDKLSIAGELDYHIGKSGYIYFFPANIFIDELPEYFLNNKISEQSKTKNKSDFLIGRDANTQLTILVGEAGNADQNKKVKVVGYITEDTTNDPVIGATIHIKDNGTSAVTNAKGELIFNIKPGKYSAVFHCMRMNDILCDLNIFSTGSFKLRMTPSNVSIEEVVVTKESNKRGSGSGIESIDYMSIKEIPTLMGEKDVIKIAQLLPGIVSVGEGSSGVNVRGGNADQNLFYLNKIPVYNSSHLFGFFSSINSTVVENFSVYKGQVPVNFGGRLSSVFDIQTKKANKNKFFTQGGISPISANIDIETPLVKNKVSLLLSGRTSYSNWILKQLEDPDLRNSKASFYDFMGTLDYTINEKNNLNMAGYLSNDYFNMNRLTTYSYGNSGVALEYNHRFYSKLKLTSNLVISNYQFFTRDITSESESYEHKYSINHNELKAELDWNATTNNTVRCGISSILYNLHRGNITPYSNKSLKTAVALGDEKAIESAIYFSDDFKIGSRITGYAGLRYSFYGELGPKIVRRYKTGVEKADLAVDEVLHYDKNKLIDTYNGPELRLGADFRTGLNGSLKIAFTQMRQYLFMLSNTMSISPTDQWKLADSHIKPQHSDQLSIGYYQNLRRQEILASCELYYKKGKEIVEYKDGVDFLSTPYVETSILQGDQDAYGAEFMISRDKGVLNGWISYTYSRSLLTIDGEKVWEKINNGNPYPSNYDKTHVINVVLNLKINRRISLSSNIVYNTGRPYTLPIGLYYLNGVQYVDYSARNQYRIPDYFRSDLSFKFEGNLKKKKFIHSYWMFSVYNITGRNNVNTVFFKSENGVINGYQYAVVGVPIFTVSWNWKLGNYANN